MLCYNEMFRAVVSNSGIDECLKTKDGYNSKERSNMYAQARIVAVIDPFCFSNG